MKILSSSLGIVLLVKLTGVCIRRFRRTNEPDCPMRKLVKPTDGAQHGDRVRYVQFADSMYNAPCQPYQRTYSEMYRFRGIDPEPCQEDKLSSVVSGIWNSTATP